MYQSWKCFVTISQASNSKLRQSETMNQLLSAVYSAELLAYPNKLAKARKMRKPLGTLSLKKFGVGNLRVEKVWTQNSCVLSYLQYSFVKYTFWKYTFGKYPFVKYSFVKYTFLKYTFENTLSENTRSEDTLSENTLLENALSENTHIHTHTHAHTHTQTHMHARTHTHTHPLFDEITNWHQRRLLHRKYYGRTNGRTWVGSRDAFASKNVLAYTARMFTTGRKKTDLQTL